MSADLIVLGGGPAGVAAALEARAQGLSVTLLDREGHLGGATRHCSHSPFGMREFGRVHFGAAYGRRLQAEAEKAGVDIRLRHSVTRIAGTTVELATPQGLTTLSAPRVLIATGTREAPRSARLLPGDRPLGVLTTGALQAMLAFHGARPFRRPVILGSEMVTLSAVATCLTHGIRPVAVIETEVAPLAPAPLTWFPGLMGIPFLTGVQVLDILGPGAEPGGRIEAVRILHRGQERLLDCDGLLLTGRFTPEATVLRQSGLAVSPQTGGPVIDQTGRLAPGLWAAGNLLRPVETGGWAFREGRRVARAMLQGEEGEVIPVTHDPALSYVLPQVLRRGVTGLDHFQLRVPRPLTGEISLQLDGRAVIRLARTWRPGRRILLPLPPQALTAGRVHIGFREGF